MSRVQPLPFTSHAFKFAATARFPALGSTLRSDAFISSTLYKDYVKTRDFLIECGAVSADDPAAFPPPPSQNPSQGSQLPDDTKKKPVLPTFPDLTTDAPHAPAYTIRIPSQRDLTRLVVSKTDSLDTSHLTPPSRTRTQHLSKHSFKSRDVNSPLADAHPFTQGHTLCHSPSKFLCSTHSLITPFPKPQFQVYTAYALGTPTMPPVLQPRKEDGTLFPCRCGRTDPDDSGHHKMVCKNGGTTRAHDQDEFVAATRPAHIQCTNSKATVPKHADSNHQGDVLITLSRAPRPFVLDVSVPHPYSGSGA